MPPPRCRYFPHLASTRTVDQGRFVYRGRVRSIVSALAFALVSLGAPVLAHADDAAPASKELGAVDLSGTALSRAEAKPDSPDADEAPPLPPRKKGVVLDSRVGVMGFTGDLAQLVTTAPWANLQVGYEIFSWLMIYGQGELAFSTTGGDGRTRTRAFPILGFGGGLRITVHATERVALFLQPGIGAIVADVPERALAIYGYEALESLGLSLNGRLGFEWYALSRHFALGLSGGPRFAPSLARSTANATAGLAWDAGAGLRYTF